MTIKNDLTIKLEMNVFEDITLSTSSAVLCISQGDENPTHIFIDFNGAGDFFEALRIVEHLINEHKQDNLPPEEEK
jgi:hypothetical protein